MEELTTNWLAIAVAAIIPLVTGFLWYGPLFGKAWMKETGITEAQAKAMNPAKTYGLAVVFSFLIGLMLWVLVFTGGGGGEIHGTEKYISFKHGALHGSLLGLFVALPVLAINSLFEGKSFKLIGINVGYWIVTMALMGGLINAWV